MSTADALRKQAVALRASAEALDAAADALDSEPTGRVGDDWIPARDCILPRTTLRRAVREGAIDSRRVGREVWVRAADVAAFVEAQREASRHTRRDSPAQGLPEPVARALAAGRLRALKGGRR